ncbi:MAG: PfkB family carbohydrate kinase [Thermoproteota archaeon]
MGCAQYTMKYAVLGNLTTDIIRTAKGTVKTIGGSACYCGLTAHKLGCRTYVLTRVGKDFEEEWLKNLRMVGLKLNVRYSRSSTIFENFYSRGRRIQLIMGNAGKIRDVPEEVLGCNVIHVGPVFSEIPVEVLRKFRKKFISLDVQGFIRKKEGKKVLNKFWSDRKRFLEQVKMVHIGAEETRFSVRRCCRELLELGPEIVAITDSVRGAYILFEGSSEYIPAFPSKTVDPTGAGDVYTAAFAVRYFETGDPIESGYFASAAASFVVEDWGPRRIGTREEVEGRKELLQKGVCMKEHFHLPPPITIE